jgi:Ca2+-binding RTX toxin-like protein
MGDTLDGGAGDDTLDGGGGTNTFVFGPNLGDDIIVDFKLGQDIVQIAQSVFPQAAMLSAAIGDDGFGNARLAINASNSISFLGVSADDLKQHVGDIHVV